MFDEILASIPPGQKHRLDLTRDEHVFRQDEPTRGIFLAESACIDMRRITPAGHAVILHRARPGTIFAEASLFSDRYHCDAICQRPGSVLRLDKGHLLDSLSTRPAFALAFCRMLARQVQSDRQTLELLAIRSARERTFAALSLGYLGGSVTGMASRIGLTHEACFRALRDLTRAGRVVRTGRGRYAVARGRE